jgi:hypothetical protein
LADLLVQSGLPVELDQIYVEKNPGGPDEGWPKWCADRAEQSPCVLVVPSTGWFAAYNGTAEPRVGCGAATEAHLFRQHLYDEKQVNSRLRLVYVDSLSPDEVPLGLKAWHQFRPLASNSDLDQLVAWIANVLNLQGIQSPTVSWPEPLADFQPDLANRHINEWPAIVDVLAGRGRHRLLMIKADSGFGKSELVHQTAEYAAQLGVPVARIDFKSSYENKEDILGQIDIDLGEHLPNFRREGASRTHLLLRDLRALRRPALIIIDSYEKAGAYSDWVCSHLLREIEKALGLAVLVAGTSCPDADDIRWRNVARQLPLGAISDAAYWMPWLERRYPNFRDGKVDVQTIILATQGVPKFFAEMCKSIATSLQNKSNPEIE